MSVSQEERIRLSLEAARAFQEKLPGAKFYPAIYHPETKQHIGVTSFDKCLTSDLKKLEGLLIRHRDSYLCAPARENGVVIVDIDDKPWETERGSDSLLDLELEHGLVLPETARSKTPSGTGEHLIYLGECKAKAHSIARRVDTAFMTPLPGVYAPGKGFYGPLNGAPFAPVPQWVIDRVGRPLERDAAVDNPACELDHPANVALAKDYLINQAPEAIEGQGGDNTAIEVALAVRDLGITEATCLDLMLEHYAARCHPFDADWLLKKVEHAYQYAKRQIGAESPLAEFEPVPQEEHPESPDDVYTFLERDQIMALPDLEWYIKGVLPARGLAVISGASKAGKSFLALDAMCAVVEGREWFGRRTKQTECRYVVLEGEGGLKQRVLAWEKKHGRPLPQGVKPFFPTAEQPFNLIKDARKLARSVPKHSIIVIDTLNRAAPAAEENTSKDMGLIIAAAKLVESITQVLVILVAHEGKDASRGIRGHSSLFAALDGNITCRKEADSYIWSIEKSKDGRDGDAYGYDLEVFEVGHDKDGDKITSCAIEPRPDKIRKKLTKTEAEAYKAWIAAATDNCAHESEWKRAMKDADPEASTSTIKKRFARMKKRLVEKGYLIENDGYYRPAGGDVAEDFEVVEDDE